MLHSFRSRLGFSVGALFCLAACSDPEFVRSPGGGGSTSVGGSGSDGGSGAGFNEGASSSSSGIVDPCDGIACDPGLQCVVDDLVPECVPITCAQANCSATEECVVLPNGGAVCVDISCDEDVDCPPEEFCNGTICVDDLCTGGDTSCVGDDLYECAQNGSNDAVKYTCGSTAYFDSNCNDDGMGNAYCGCADDWDCPSFTVCDVDQCSGTGVAPTCQLAPLPFTDALPAPEIVWGGTSESQKDALGRPFEKSSQVVMTPAVANLDDDNGDGLINERDFPEVVFLTFCNQEISNNGILRAIHGGGPNKGADYFAVCGATTWHEGDPMPTNCATGAVTCANADINSTAAIAIGDIDYDGTPEIVVITENRAVQVYRNDGTIAATSASNIWPAAGYANPAPAIANLDNSGFAEVVVGRFVVTFANDVNGNLTVVDTFSGSLMNGTQGQGPAVCLANLTGDTRQEIVAGTSVYAFPDPPVGATNRAECALFPPSTPEETAYCNGQLLVAWDGQTVNGTTLIPNSIRDGFCAVADLLGSDPLIAPSPTNPLDGLPEVVLINEGNFLVLDGATGIVLRKTALGLGSDGGAPNIDDYDGDGFPEVGSAFGAAMTVIDLQDTSASCPAWPTVLSDAISLTGPQSNPPRTPPAIACSTDADCSGVDAGTTCNVTVGECVCLHNGWQRQTEDDSSRVTGSSVFDFNGDGGAEVIYNDECFFRVYDGLTADVLFKEPSESRTRIEYPVVADVDNDGNAEIVFATSNESGFCSVGASYDYSNGIEVWGDPSDTWVSGRRIWSEHAYHVTNVTEGGSVPVTEPESWRPYNGRLYNTYRSNPRSYGVAPDLAVTAIQFTSPGETCGVLSDQLDITFQIDNLGDLRVGPGVVVRFDGNWTGLSLMEPLYADAAMTPLEVVLSNSIEPGESILLTVSYDAVNNSPMVLPDEVTVIVDALSQENECDETNNELTEPVLPGAAQADLRLSIDSITQICPPTVTATVFNDGSADASGVIVRFYAGDPNQGGAPIQDVAVPGTIPAGGSVTITPVLSAFPSSAQVTTFGVVDPDNLIPECNDGNNKDAAPTTVSCGPA